VIGPVVLELPDIQDIIASEGIGIDDAIRLDFSNYSGHQLIRSGIRNGQNKDLAATLQKAKDRNLANGTSTALALSDATKIILVSLYSPRRLKTRQKYHLRKPKICPTARGHL